ncbi:MULTISPECIES: DNA primase [Clostridium]|uniref:DNA primase n=3 Tax=Clostridium TaxID=1485 RepID=A0ABP3WU90_9CLOT|nr:DNA primase [Clostridium baratii]AQM60343.1 DNA primase [Clostridium baratii]KJU70808.1 DNA primase [Clostridium baratii]MBT9832816.1 DNA primase [Clostridium baratii]STA99264.1 DNA primase DnaG [Clostridium baratii]
MRITEETIERIKQENDIVDIISETVKLKRSGRNYMGLCPFHNEKSPSFSVSQDKQIYKCFGCGEAGNVLTFVMKNRNLNFIEACKVLAEKANIRLDLGNGEESKVVKKKELLYKVNVEAARYFFSNLQRDKNSKEYFTNRGIKEITIKRFGLGYAKDGWQNLRTHLKRKGFNDELMLEAGLVLKSQKGTIYDRFRNRVMFPVFNSKGNVIGFGGRVLDDSKPKYLNSPETLVFQKGTNLYGLNFAIKHKNEERYFIIVEGYMDLISLHQYGITNVVASLGTALTTNQARLLKRYADKVIISYDADFAGQTATLRGLEILKEAGFDVRVLQIPQGKDPDEFVRSNGRDAFLKLVNKAESLISYRLKKAKDGINFKDKSSLIEYGNRVAEILANLNPVEKDIYVKSISEDTGIKEQSLYDLISMTKNTKSEDFMNKKEEFGTKLYVEPGYVKAEKSLIKLMLDEDYYNEIIENISSDDLNSKAHAKIFNLIKESKDKGLENTNLHVEAGCDDVESSKEWVKIKEFQVLKAEDKHRLILDYIKQIKNFKLTKQLDLLRKKLKELENNGLIEESIKVALELNKINDALKKGERD